VVAIAVIGVGGFLGIGEKSVAIPFASLSFEVDAQGQAGCHNAGVQGTPPGGPSFEPTEKTDYTRAKEKVGELGQKASEKASELRDKAARKIEDMRGERPVSK
jgi:hypothetical protein